MLETIFYPLSFRHGPWYLGDVSDRHVVVKLAIVAVGLWTWPLAFWYGNKEWRDYNEKISKLSDTLKTRGGRHGP